MSQKRIDSLHAPSHERMNDPLLIRKKGLEIKKLKPKASLSLAQTAQLFDGVISHWEESSKTFRFRPTRFESLSPLLDQFQDEDFFFRVPLLTSQLLFRTRVFSRDPKTQSILFHFPKVFFQNQKRSALRVPVNHQNFFLKIGRMTIPVTDLSVNGAQLLLNPKQIDSFKKSTLDLVYLYQNDSLVFPETLNLQIRRQINVYVGVKFLGIKKETSVKLKQVLVQALHRYYENLPK